MAGAPLDAGQAGAAREADHGAMTIASPAELYAHAIAIEREAAKRYGQFAERMADEGREDLARIFDMLAGAEGEHLAALERRTAGIELPRIAEGRYHWLDDGAPESAAEELVFRLMSSRQALAIALRAEQRAQAFFEHVGWTASDPALRALAREMAAEEREHIALVARLLERSPEPALDTTLIFGK
jgi:rubrerythrin